MFDPTVIRQTVLNKISTTPANQRAQQAGLNGITVALQVLQAQNDIGVFNTVFLNGNVIVFVTPPMPGKIVVYPQEFSIA